MRTVNRVTGDLVPPLGLGPGHLDSALRPFGADARRRLGIVHHRPIQVAVAHHVGGEAHLGGVGAHADEDDAAVVAVELVLGVGQQHDVARVRVDHGHHRAAADVAGDRDAVLVSEAHVAVAAQPANVDERRVGRLPIAQPRPVVCDPLAAGRRRAMAAAILDFGRACVLLGLQIVAPRLRLVVLGQMGLVIHAVADRVRVGEPAAVEPVLVLVLGRGRGPGVKLLVLHGLHVPHAQHGPLAKLPREL